MPASLQFTPKDRVLIIAPHPDDESLATGGLIQRAVRAGAEVRVIFVSDGDNNPWPQRALERRWRIAAADRERWGARRRAEALAALRSLGVMEKGVRFLGWPDQGTTAVLLHAQENSVAALARQIENSRPTLLVAPSLHDVHPDHNALAVQLHLALGRLARPPRLLRYIVHRRGLLPAARLTLRLTPSEQAAKRDAILCHTTQMALGRKRFLAYARSTELYFRDDAAPPGHPILRTALEAGALCITLQPGKLAPGRLLVAFESLLEGSVRWSVSLQRRPGLARIRDAATGAPRRSGTVRALEGRLEVRLPLAPVRPATRAFVKYDRRLAFYDHAGWCEIPLPTPALSCPALPSSATSCSSSSFVPSSSGGVSADLG